jgi:hypothetical protein
VTIRDVCLELSKIYFGEILIQFKIGERWIQPNLFKIRNFKGIFRKGYIFKEYKLLAPYKNYELKNIFHNLSRNENIYFDDKHKIVEIKDVKFTRL